MAAELLVDSEAESSNATEHSPSVCNSSAASTVNHVTPVSGHDGGDPLRKSVKLTVDAASTVLFQTVHAVTSTERQYVELIHILISLMERELLVLGQKIEEEKVSELILSTRHQINDVRQHRQDLAFLFASVTKLVNATADVACSSDTSCDPTGINESLRIAILEVQEVKAASEKVEKEMHLMEIRSIEVITRYGQRR